MKLRPVNVPGFFYATAVSLPKVREQMCPVHIPQLLAMFKDPLETVVSR